MENKIQEELNNNALQKGYDSFGQIFAGFIIALVLHIYHIGSPLFMRPIDYFVNIIGGLCTFILVKVNNLNFFSHNLTKFIL